MKSDTKKLLDALEVTLGFAEHEGGVTGHCEDARKLLPKLRKLIAAAPELLAICQRIYEDATEDEDTTITDKAYFMLQDVLAKAKGE